MRPDPLRSPERRSSLLLGLPLACGLAGCASHRYEPHELDSAAVVRDLVVERAALGAERAAGEPLTLARAALWLRERGPDVREAIAGYRTALARARVATPLPNPSLEIGPELGFGDDVQTREVTATGALGWSFPLGSRLEREDARNLAAAERARVDALATFREQYLELRARYARLGAARARYAVHAELARSTEASIAMALEMVEAGSAAALDVSLFRLDHARERARLVESESASRRAESDLAALVAVDAGDLGPVPAEVAALPAAPPELAPLRDGLAGGHPELLRRRAAYELAERELALEVSREVPDLSIGVGGGGETGEQKTVLRLGLGLDLLVFDHNQQAIAQAEERREAARAEYEAAVQRALTELERAHRALEPAMRRHRLLHDEVLPAAFENVEIAHESLAAGSADALQVLDAERSLRQVQIEHVDAGLEETLAWCALERAAGRPLVSFPSDPDAAGAEPPEEIAAPLPAAEDRP